MNEKDVKRAFSDAEKELEEAKVKEKEKQVQEVKNIVKRTLQEIEKLKDEKASIEEKLKILKLDIDDLKQGKLELIKERQDNDPLAKRISVIIIKEKETIREVPSPWYQPWVISWNQVYRDNTPFVFSSYNSTCSSNNLVGSLSVVDCVYDDNTILTNSIVKDNVIGSYILEDKTINLR